jgi:hypothetical protein
MGKLEKRLVFQTIISALTIIGTIFWGFLGLITMSLLALIPVFFRIKKVDEREQTLYHKSTSASMGVTILIMFLLQLVTQNQFPNFSFFKLDIALVMHTWAVLVTCGFMFFQGVFGIFYFSRG